MTIRLEVCIDDVLSLDACAKGGADRIELCSALDLGGLTPSPGLIAAAAKSPLPSRAMIRPRAGDFHFAEAEVEVMLADIATVRNAGLAGVVLGAMTAENELDVAVLARLVDAAGSLGKTLHRAIDLLPDPVAAVDLAVHLGFDCILTSGGELTAEAGVPVIAAMVERAAGRIDIMAGSGVRPENAAIIHRETGVHWLHSSCGRAEANADDVRHFGFGPAERRFADADRIRALKAAVFSGERA
ncbi:copper homeostasis protein CutC [Pleomorphomonas diazotrophica]|uniref:PF03932 family protein CutC n=1 Tax=Pleomorphomonas diazotrophica TaxID=1166257 RepID=A0A1I4QTR5_9HYPH|nr:copper homeostasis protein CutC [Pleomorphomonas diazotrophica]PKR90445.1 copper homeostasis protein CutC [Pleomorphomonas diazotrophica]SFM43103.1 copper homeostasis protein [Pleomorphomonas diazotrophica]